MSYHGVEMIVFVTTITTRILLAWLYERFELYYTPEHQSWLNMAEIELSILSRECINRRISNQKTLTSKVALETKTAIM